MNSASPNGGENRLAGQGKANLDEAETQAGINQGRWTRDEHALFLKGLQAHGKEWKKIADLIKTRTVVQIRTHAQKYFQKLAKSTGGPVMSTSKKGDIVRPPNRKFRKYDMLPSSPSDEEESGSEFAQATLKAAGHSASYPAKNSVPSYHQSLGLDKLNVEIKKAKDDAAGGGITPRTVAAATILLRPRIQDKLRSGGDTPKTRQQASWLLSQEARSNHVLGKRPRRTPTAATGSSLTWDSAKH